nr:family 43 glycosylhydrolase [Dysgonomonas sp. Marseille-Q5470]
MKLTKIILFVTICLLSFNSFGQSWTADNRNGTYTNPLFYDEFSDPDIIRVGDDFYLAGTTMHCMPGLVVLHSKDLVNWTFMSYALDSLSLGPEFNLRNGKEAYGQGVWAPCIRYHNGMFYIFTNVNNHGMQVYMAGRMALLWVAGEPGTFATYMDKTQCSGNHNAIGSVSAQRRFCGAKTSTGVAMEPQPC